MAKDTSQFMYGIWCAHGVRTKQVEQAAAFSSYKLSAHGSETSSALQVDTPWCFPLVFP